MKTIYQKYKMVSIYGIVFSCRISILCENNRIAETIVVDILANHIFNII